MIGVIIVGGLAAMGVASLVRRHRWHHGYGWGHHGWHHHHHGWGHHPNAWHLRRALARGCAFDGGWAPHHHHTPSDVDADDDRAGRAWFGPEFEAPPLPWRFRRGRRWMMKSLFRRLETTPTQQDALRAALEEFQQSAKVLKGEAGRTRSEVAAALRRPAIDAEALGELFARHDSALNDIRKSFVGMTIKVHDILDEKQRARLARLIETGPRGLGDELSGGW